MDTLEIITSEIKSLHPMPQNAEQLEELIRLSIKEIRNTEAQGKGQFLLRLKQETLHNLQYKADRLIQSYKMRRGDEHRPCDMEVRWAWKEACSLLGNFILAFGYHSVADKLNRQ